VTLKRVAIPSPNYSSRGGATVTTICLHTAEGARTYQDLGAWFANPSSQVSSHVGVDDTLNTVGEYVPRSGKAWTAANANPWCIQAELCAFAAWTPADWNAHPTMLANTAAWVAEEAAYFSIPITKLNASDAQNPNVRGVCQHVDLGSMGGGHWDCGSNFPIDHVLDMARGGSQPPPPQEDDDLPLHIVIGHPNTDGNKWWLTDWVQKWWLPSSDAAAQIIVSTRATGGKIECNPQNGPVQYDQRTIDAVPVAK